MIRDERENIRRQLAATLATTHYYASTKIKQSQMLGYDTKHLEAIATKINAALHHADIPTPELRPSFGRRQPVYSPQSKYYL